MLLNPFLTLLWVYTHTHTTAQMNGVLCCSASCSPSTQTGRKPLGGATGTLTAKWPRRIEVHSGTRPHDPFQVGAYLCWIFKKLNGYLITHKTYICTITNSLSASYSMLLLYRTLINNTFIYVKDSQINELLLQLDQSSHMAKVEHNGLNQLWRKYLDFNYPC